MDTSNTKCAVARSILMSTTGNRGFLYMPELLGINGERVHVYESSSVDVDGLWVGIDLLPLGDGVVAHLDLDTARQLAEQIEHVIEHRRSGGT